MPCTISFIQSTARLLHKSLQQMLILFWQLFSFSYFLKNRNIMEHYLFPLHIFVRFIFFCYICDAFWKKEKSFQTIQTEISYFIFIFASLFLRVI
uniref:Uncharacterized protein n=1 Tax=Octopus bimaculoides TaxID=37653 RepID=A0A0L8IFD3_OCTBM